MYVISTLHAVTDQQIIEVCKDVIMHLAAARNDIVQEKMLPTLVSIVQQRQPDSLPSSLQPVSLPPLLSVIGGFTPRSRSSTTWAVWALEYVFSTKCTIVAP